MTAADHEGLPSSARNVWIKGRIRAAGAKQVLIFKSQKQKESSPFCFQALLWECVGMVLQGEFLENE